MAAAEIASLAEGFRLRVPATSLWFHVDADRWARIRAALADAGAETATSGLDGEEACGAPGVLVTYRGAEQRMQTELTPTGTMLDVELLAALHEAAPPSAADASPVWLWAPEPFALSGAQAEPALRAMRAARWVLALASASPVLLAAESAYQGLGENAALRIQIGPHVEVEIAIPPQAAARSPLGRRAAAFADLLARLGPPTWAEYSTHPAGGAVPAR